MARWGVLAGLVILLAACGGEDDATSVGAGAAAPSPTVDVLVVDGDHGPLDEHIVEVLPGLSEPATMRDDLVVSTPVLADVVWSAAPERRGGRDEPFEHPAVRSVLKGCDQRTATTWRFTGELSAPEYPVPVSFSLGFEYTWRGSDTVGTSFSGSRFTATLLREGTFVVDLPVEGAPRAPAAGGDPSCLLGQQSSSTTRRPAFRAEPLEWDAPAGSVQALGSGVVLADPHDRRLAWAHAYWSGLDLGFDEIWIPPIDEFSALHVSVHRRDPDCVRLRVGYETGGVTQERGCRVSAAESGDAPERPFDPDVAAPDGFRWLLIEGDEPTLERDLGDGTLVRVSYADPVSSTPDETIDRLAAMAASLEPHDNVPEVQPD